MEPPLAAAPQSGRRLSPALAATLAGTLLAAGIGITVAATHAEDIVERSTSTISTGTPTSGACRTASGRTLRRPAKATSRRQDWWRR
ncbi:hypothetical protein K353_06119 [Kitasatospora sp. SolWspMP-SS2h]|nr:hypothetical protein K353_06119 [Kitasatospora sp. SolWspMP-SS2h]